MIKPCMSPSKPNNPSDERASNPLRLHVYMRHYCHLCHDFLAQLAPWQQTHGIHIHCIDIDQDASLEERYGSLIPVLTDENNHEICHYFLDETALIAYLNFPHGRGGGLAGG